MSDPSDLQPDPAESQEQVQQLLEIEQEDILHIVLGGQSFLVRASETLEIIRPVPLTPVPMGPDHILGLANIHGQIFSIIDASGVTKLPPRNEQTHLTRFLLLRHPRMHMGIWVDEVRALYRIRSDLLPDIESSKDDSMHPTAGNVEVDGVCYELLRCAVLFH